MRLWQQSIEAASWIVCLVVDGVASAAISCWLLCVVLIGSFEVSYKQDKLSMWAVGCSRLGGVQNTLGST